MANDPQSQQGSANFYLRFRRTAESWPELAAIEVQHLRADAVERVTFAELRRRAESAAHWLGVLKLRAGSGCSTLASNGPAWVAAYLGILAAGHAAVPFDTAFTAAQVRRLLLDSGSALLFCDAEHAAIAEEAVGGTAVR